MILQALHEYYQRKAVDPDSGIAPEGFEWKEIPFVIVIDRDGNLVAIEDTRQGTGSARRGKRFLVPQSVKRTVGIKANLLWDDVEYALGANPRGRPDIAARHAAFVERIRVAFPSPSTDPRIRALLRFLERGALGMIEGSPVQGLWGEALEAKANVTFKIDGDSGELCDVLRPNLQSSIRASSDHLRQQTCLVSGELSPIARLHPPVKGVRDAQTSGGALVSFNLEPFCSFGKGQNFNAPISESAAFAYTTALNCLLARDSTNRMQVGDATTVFWSARRSLLEDSFADFFVMPPKDEPDRDVRAVRSLYECVETAAAPEESSTEFYVLGLAPNAARLAVRYWHRDTVGGLSTHIYQHFRDLEIVRAADDQRRLALCWLLVDLATEGKVDNVPPNLAGAVMRAVLQGGAYPASLVSQAIRRVRAERKVTPTRAAILKASLNRARRIHSQSQQEIKVALDTTNNSPGYRLGRLFAVLEKIQEDAQKGINATIRDRYYGAASANPVTVFPQLLKLKNHHLAKLDNPAFRTAYEKRLAEIVEGLAPDMPAHLTLDEQARFAIGYYHQRHALFAKTPSKDSTHEDAAR